LIFGWRDKKVTRRRHTQPPRLIEAIRKTDKTFGQKRKRSAGMDHPLFNAACLAAQGALHILFAARLTGQPARTGAFALYLSLLFALDALVRRANLPWPLAISAQIGLLYAVCRFPLGNRRAASALAALLAVYFYQLSFGLVNAAESLLLPRLIGSALLPPLAVLASLAALLLCACCYAAARRFLPPGRDGPASALTALLLPLLFFLSAELYVLQTSYNVLPAAPAPLDARFHVSLLLLQLAGLAAALCTLRTCRRLSLALRAREDARSLAQAVRAQKDYIGEARARDERTRAFRHDLANHLSVLDGLLRDRSWDEARDYLRGLTGVSGALSAPCQTGCPAVDVLLGEKLALAGQAGIRTEVSLRLPQPCAVDAFDLCVVFANALDNALRACRSVEGARFLRVHGRRQGDFYLLTFENSCPDGPLPPPGTGLANIRSVAEKYRGAMRTEQDGGRFSLRVLLILILD